MFLQIKRLPVRMCLFYVIVVLMLTRVTRVQTLDIAVSQQESHNSHLPPDDQFTSPGSGEFIVNEGSSFFIKCVSSNHYSSNSSLVWNVNTKVRSRNNWDVKIIGMSKNECFRIIKCQ